MAKILLVEDEVALAEVLTKLLKDDGHHVDLVVNGVDAEQLINHYSYELVILDWNIPGKNGLELCKEYRSRGGTTPVLFLTGNSAWTQKVDGLDSGADDYVCKPFQPEELLARVRALLRRQQSEKMNVLLVNEISLDLKSQSVTVEGREVNLVRKELAILEFLLRHPNRVFSLQSLVEKVWPSYSEVVPESLRPYMTRLRAKLAHNCGYSPIVTVHGLGYKLESKKDTSRAW